MKNQISENVFINSLIKNFHRSPMQINKVHESDAEIIKIGNGSNIILAVTTDSIAEEIKSGLYDDPYLIGWMSVMVNLSDLAAVGAKPLGILISEILPHDYSPGNTELLHTGISDACKKCGTFVLGGDTNSGDDLIITGTAIGIPENNKHLSRIGCRCNDILYSTGFLGRGNGFAVSKFFNQGNLKFDYCPEARINQGVIIKDFASACMDTSDGVVSTLDQLMRLNNLGFKLDKDWEDKIDKGSLELARASSIPEWLLLAGYHGEFELLFTIPEKLENKFLINAKKINWQPVKLGSAIDECKIEIPIYGKLQEIDSTRIRNLAYKIQNGVESYLKSLLSIDQEMQIN